MLGDVFPVLDRLDVALFGMQHAVDALDHVDRDRHTLLGRLLAHEVERLAVAPDLFDDGLQARVERDLAVAGAHGRPELGERVDDALERAVVRNPAHVEVGEVLRLRLGRRALQPVLEVRRALLDRTEPSAAPAGAASASFSWWVVDGIAPEVAIGGSYMPEKTRVFRRVTDDADPHAG